MAWDSVNRHWRLAGTLMSFIVRRFETNDVVWSEFVAGASCVIRLYGCGFEHVAIS